VDQTAAEVAEGRQMKVFARWRLGAYPSRDPRGQSLVEFALVFPLLMVLLLGVADFGRVFSAGITTEAAARDAAETGAISRLRTKPPGPGDPPYYQALHQEIAKIACSESRLLPNATFVATDRTCPSEPVIRVCVHDGQDPACGQPINGFGAAIPAECSGMGDPWSNATSGESASHSVEVRICYHFTTLFNLHLSLPLGFGLSLGDVWLQRTRFFVVDCPPGGVATC